MKNETIWNIQDILDSHVNLKLDLQMDLKNSEFSYYQKSCIRSNIFQQNQKIKELKQCIKWLKSIK